MKKIFLPLFAALITGFLFTGCASSERMTRMSGGVFDEYVPPSSMRIRAEKYQKVSQNFQRHSKLPGKTLAGIDEKLVNIWPFFFSDRNYCSILWPFIDWDKYGMAVRPFYNHEGDDYSIFFPLIAWNNVSKSGWVFNAAWTNQGFGFVPFSWQHDDPKNFWCYYTPFFIRDYDKYPLGYNAKDPNASRWRRGDMCNVFLGYRSKTTMIDNQGWNLYMFDPRAVFSTYAPTLAYRLSKSKQFPVPKNQQEFNKLIPKLAQTLTRTYDVYNIGFVPLFHAKWRSDEPGSSWRAFAYLFGMESSQNNFEWDFLGNVGAAYEASYDRTPVMERGFNSYKEEQFFLSPLLLSSYHRRENFVRTKEINALQELCSFSLDFNRNLNKIKAQLKILDPKAKLPATVTDGASYRLFLQDFAREYMKGKNFDTYTTGHGGFWPLFVYSKPTRDYSYWFSIATITGGSHSAKRQNFWSIPLMTFVRRNPSGSFTGIFPPFIYMNDTDLYSRIDNPINSRQTKWVNKWRAVEDSGTYALCGLLYRGKHSFYVAKEGIDAKTAETFRSKLIALNVLHNYLTSQRKNYQKKMQDNQAWKTRNKIEYYRKMIRFEELKETLANIEKTQKRFDKKVATVKACAEKLDFPFDPAIIPDRKKINAELEKFFDRYTELRSKEDIGNGFFYRKEKFHNGDYRWHFLHILAGGEKSGDRESAHFLQLLYRKRIEGSREETLFFPFVSIQKDGDNEKFSIMGRIFQTRKHNGKRSGYFLFIPFGA